MVSLSSEEEEDVTDHSLGRASSWELREQQRVDEVIFAVKARGLNCTEDDARQALAESSDNKDEAVDKVLQQRVSLPESSRVCFAFEFVRNPPGDGGPSFQSYADGLSMARAVVCGDQDSIDDQLRPGEDAPTAEEAWLFLDQPPARHNESLLHWGINVIKSRTPSDNRGQRMTQELDSEKSNCLRALSEAVKVVDEALNQGSLKYLNILSDILNKDNTWYAGKHVRYSNSTYNYSTSGSRMTEHVKGCPEHYDTICQLVYQLGTFTKVRNLLCEEGGETSPEANSWIALEFSCDMHVLKNQYEEAHGDSIHASNLLQKHVDQDEYFARWQQQADEANGRMISIQNQIRSLASEYFDKQLNGIDALQQALADSYDALAACDKEDRAAKQAAERELQLVRESGDQMSMTLQILTQLKDLQLYLEQDSDQDLDDPDVDTVREICSRIVLALCRTDEKDAKHWNTHAEDAHSDDVFTQVFEELNDLMGKQCKEQYLAELHCALQCWQTDSLPKHAFGLKTVLAVAWQKVHARRNVPGPRVGQTFHCQNRSFEVVQILQQLENKRNYTTPSYGSATRDYDEQLQFEIRYRWRDTLEEGVETIGFPLQTQHSVRDPCALSAFDFHGWLQESNLFEDLFGKNFHMQLLGSSGKELIKYMSQYNLLTQEHADSMVGRISKAHRSEKAEAHARLLDVLVSLDAAGQAHLLQVIAELLPNNEVIDMLLSKHDLCQMLSTHVAAVALLDCLLGLMPHSESSEQLEQMQQLFAEVIRTEEETRRAAAEAKAAEGQAEGSQEEYMPPDDELSPVDGQEQQSLTEQEPLRIQYVRQCRERIVGSSTESAAAYGLLERILCMCHSMKNRGIVTADELDETFSQLNCDGVEFMPTIVSSFKPLLELDVPKEEILSKLQPQLNLLTAMIKLCAYAAPFGMEQLEALLQIFASSTTVSEFFECFLQWVASLVNLLEPPLLRHAFLLISEHEGIGALGICGFEAFKQLFLRVNGLQPHVGPSNMTYGDWAPAITVTSLSLDGMLALWKASLGGGGQTGESARQLLRTVYFEHTRAINGTHEQLLVAIFRCLSFCSLALAGQLQEDALLLPPAVVDANGGSMSGSLDRRESFDLMPLINERFMPWSVAIADNTLALLEECLHHTEHEQQCPSHRSSNFGTPLEVEVEAKILVDVGVSSGVGSTSKPHWEEQTFQIVTHTNSTMTSFKESIALAVQKENEKMNIVLRYGEKYSNDQSSTMLKGATLAQAGLSATGEFKVWASILPQHKGHQPPPQSVADDVMGSQSYFDTLFELCAASVVTSERRLSMRVWQLIQSLPSSTCQLNALEVPEEVDWESLLGVSEVPTAVAFKAAYVAQIVSSFLQPANPCRTEWSRQWRRGFITSGGFLMINSFFTSLVDHFANPMPPRVQYALAAVLQVMRFCITGALRSSEIMELGTDTDTSMARSPFASASIAVVTQVDYEVLLHGLLQVLRVSFTSHDESVAINALHTIVPIMSTSEDYAELVLSEPQLLARLLVENQTQLIRKATQETLFKICERLPAKTCVVLGFINDALQSAGPNATTLTEALELVSLLLEHAEAGEEAPQLLRTLILFIQNFPVENDDETILTKTLQLFADIISRWPSLILAQSLSPHEQSPDADAVDTNLAELAIDLLWVKCLYGNRHSTNPKCVTVAAREAAGNAILEIVKNSPKYILVLLERLKYLHDMLPVATTVGWDHWYLDPNTEAARRPAKGGYLGLRNQGLCCYQNSILQQLYTVPDVRTGILSTNADSSVLEKAAETMKADFELSKQDPDADADDVKQMQRKLEQQVEKIGQTNLLAELQRTFAQLQFGVGTFFDPVKFVDACEGVIRLDHPVREQNDANDFFNKLCDQMDEALKGSPHAKLFERQLRIVTESEWSIKKDGKTMSRPGPEDVALAINIEVEGQNTLEESLALNFQPEDGFELKWTMEDGTEESVESTKTPRIKSAPKTLVFNLKRYVFSLETLEYARCADHFEFPRDIDIGPYMIDKGSCVYTLSGVVIHEGSSGGGHYYSYARDRDNDKWFKFDDATVTAWDCDASLADDTFGGTKTSTWTNQFGEPKTWSTSKPGAYVLFYDQTSTEESSAAEEAVASSPESIGSCPGDSLEQLQSISTAPLSEAYDAVMAQNAHEMRVSHVCNLAHIKLLQNLLRIALQLPAAAIGADTLEGILTLAFQFFCGTVVRIGYRKWNSGSVGGVNAIAGVKIDKEEERKTAEEEAIEEVVIQWRNQFAKGMSAHPSARMQLLEMPSRELKRLMLDCPHDYARKAVASLLVKACDGQSSAMLGLFLKLLSLMPDVKTSNAAQLGMVLALLAMDKDVKAYAREHDVIAQILHYMLGPKTPVNDLRVVAEKGWGSRNYGINFSQEVFIKCLCSLLDPLEGLPELSRTALEHNNDVRVLILSSGAPDSVRTFVNAVSRSSEESTLQIAQWLARGYGEDLNRTTDALMTLLSLEDGTEQQHQRVQIALAALRQEAELACHQGQTGHRVNYQAGGTYPNYSSAHATHNRIKKLVQLLVHLSVIGPVKVWVDQNKEFLVSLRKYMQELMRESKVTSSTGYSYTQSAKLQRTKSTIDAELALAQLIGEMDCPDVDDLDGDDADFEARVDEIHALLKQVDQTRDSYDDKRQWCEMAARQEKDAKAAVDWILSNEYSLESADYSSPSASQERKRKGVNWQSQQSSDEDIYYGPTSGPI